MRRAAEIQIASFFRAQRQACRPPTLDRALDQALLGALPVGRAETPVPDSIDRTRLAAQRARLPRPWKHLRGLEATWQGDGRQYNLVLQVEGAEQLEFFPAPEAPLELKRRTFSEKSRELSLAFEPRIGDESPTIAAHGLLRVRREGRLRWNRIDPGPIQRIYDRWVSRYVRQKASALSRLKDHVEGGRKGRKGRKL